MEGWPAGRLAGCWSVTVEWLDELGRESAGLAQKLMKMFV
jgi:hypothetical protein